MKRWVLGLLLGFGVLSAVAAGAAWFGLQGLSRELPSVASLRELQLAVPLRVYSREQKLIGEFGAERRALLRYPEIPPQLVQAFLAAEDDRFFEHPGFDWQGLLRAALKLATSGERAQGGSTITMQLARNVFLSSERTFTRKFKEILLALRIERELSKEEILELYLNKIFLGERAYGVGAASLVYFGKDAAQLSLAECAVIAGLPKAPSRDNPVANPERARERRDYVLQRMLALEYIDKPAYAAAIAEPVVVHPYRAKVEVDAHYVAEMVRAEMVTRYGDEAYTRGFHVLTTISADRQLAANAALRRALLDYDERHGWRGAETRVDPALLQADRLPALLRQLDALPSATELLPAVVVRAGGDALQLQSRLGPITLGKDAFAWANLAKKPLQPGDIVRLRRHGEQWRLTALPQVQAAFVALDPRDGAIEALVGGFDFFANKFNRVTQAQRQAGSGFKPFLYAAALAQGYTPASVFLDAPIVFDDPSLASSWRPENYDGDLQGQMRLREALVQSRNLVSIRLLQAVGLSTAREFIPRFGLPADRLPNDLTLALGTASYTPLEMARAYATLANGGFVIEPYFIAEIRDAGGQTLFKASVKRACPECITAAVAPDAGGEASMTPASAAAPAELPADRAPQTIDPAVVWLLDDMLHDVTVRGTAAKVNALGRSDLAGKTGTTNDETDAWFNGFQQTQVGVAWVGFDTPTPLGRGEVGGRTALPIWIDYMRSALKNVPQQRLPRPAGLVEVRIDPQTGRLARAGAPSVFEIVQQGHVPEADSAADTSTEPGRAPLEDLF